MDRKYRIWTELGRYSPESEPASDEPVTYSINNIRDRYVKVLIENGYKTIEEVQNATVEELIGLDGIGEKMAIKIFSEV